MFARTALYSWVMDGNLGIAQDLAGRLKMGQNTTGIITEKMVKGALEALGLEAVKPVPDRGVDLLVSKPGKQVPVVRVQVKGRGERQKNKKYRWFQIRTTEAQRNAAVAEGMSVSEAWRKKAALVDVFVFVSMRHQEFWVFEQSEIERIIELNRPFAMGRKDNREGIQAEMNLDIVADGQPLTKMFAEHRNNWRPLLRYFE